MKVKKQNLRCPRHEGIHRV